MSYHKIIFGRRTKIHLWAIAKGSVRRCVSRRTNIAERDFSIFSHNLIITDSSLQQKSVAVKGEARGDRWRFKALLDPVRDDDSKPRLTAHQLDRIEAGRQQPSCSLVGTLPPTKFGVECCTALKTPYVKGKYYYVEETM